MRERIFRFKQFQVSHSQSAMKVGVDAVLLGALVNLHGATSILDAGCGCGLIALICAQRSTAPVIQAIDLHTPSVVEAGKNFAASPWAGRLKAVEKDFMKMGQERFSHIISNPPFFNAGIATPLTAREAARHAAALTPCTLIEKGAELLLPQGLIALISPPCWIKALEKCAAISGMRPERITWIRTTPQSPPKRVVTQWRKYSGELHTLTDSIVIQTAPETFTEEYKALTRDFYLKF